MNTLRHKLSVVLRMVRIFKNWPSVIAYRLGITTAPMIIVLRDGAKFFVRERATESADAYVINETYLYGIHDSLLPHLKHAKIGLDVGAHMGSFSIFAAHRSPAKIFAVEPAPQNVEMLKRNIALNHLESRIIPVPKAMASRTGTTELYMPVNSGLISTTKNHVETYGADAQGGVKTVTVPTISLPDLFREYGIDFCDFIKMDCEGAEYDVFYNLPDAYFAKIGFMSIDCHVDGDIRQFIDFLKSKGFEVTRPSMEFAELFCRNTRATRA